MPGVISVPGLAWAKAVAAGKVIFWADSWLVTATSTFSSWPVHGRLDLVAGNTNLPGGNQVATFHCVKQCLGWPGRFEVDLRCQCPHVHQLAGDGPRPQDRAVQGSPHLVQGRIELLTWLFRIRSGRAPRLILEDLSHSSPVAFSKQSVFGRSWSSMTDEPPVRSRQAGPRMVPTPVRANG